VARARIGGLTDRDLQEIRDKKRWDEATARRALDAFQKSGLSMAAFAAETGIGAWRLRGWHPSLTDPRTFSGPTLRNSEGLRVSGAQNTSYMDLPTVLDRWPYRVIRYVHVPA